MNLEGLNNINMQIMLTVELQDGSFILDSV